MTLAFVLIVASYLCEPDNVQIYVNGDEVDKDAVVTGSVAATPDIYKLDPNEIMEISAKVTNERDGDYDFKVVVWEGPSVGSQDTKIFESESITIKESQFVTFSKYYQVPLEPGTYYYSIISYYAPVGHPNFGQYDDGTNFAIEVLDTTPIVYDDTPTATATPTPTVTPTETATPNATATPMNITVDGVEDEEPLFDPIDFEDENFKMVIGIVVAMLIVILGYFVIRNKWLD